MNDKQICNKIRKLIGNDNLKEALDLLKKNVNTKDLRNDVIMQFAKYNELKRLEQNGIIDYEKINVLRAKLRYVLLKLVDELEIVQFEKPVNKRRSIYWILIFSSIISSSYLIINLRSTETLSGDMKACRITVDTSILYDTNVRVISDSVEKKLVDEIKNRKENRQKIEIKKEEQGVNNTKNGGGITKPYRKLNPVLKGQILDKFNKGISDVTIQTHEGVIGVTNEFGLFNITLEKTIENYRSKIYLFYSKDSIQDKDLVRIGQENIVLRFKY